MVEFAALSDEEKKESGALLVRFVIEVLGRPKDHVVATRDEILKKIKEDKEIHLVDEYLAEPKEDENDFWSSFMELEGWFISLKKLVQFAIGFMPSHIEVLEPENAVFQLPALNEVLNDLVLKLHAVDKIYQQERFERERLSKIVTVVVKNAIVVALSKAPMDKATLSKFVGVAEESLPPFLEQLQKENRIVEQDGTYRLVMKNVQENNNEKKNG